MTVNLPQLQLHPHHLSLLPDTIKRFHYDREQLKTGIVHLGIGAFMRAHLAPINDAFINSQAFGVDNHRQLAGDALNWGIVGVSLRQADTRDALAPQAGLYTLALRDADGEGEPRQVLHVIGCVKLVLVAPEDPPAVIHQIAHPETRIVSLTITEKGYYHLPSTGALQIDHPDVQHDLAQPELPKTAIGFIVRGLKLRKEQSRSPVTLMSLDNLPSNGHLLKNLILSFAQLVDHELCDWIEQTCTFPCSMVDRIVPRTTPSDKAQVCQSLGQLDAWPVMAEPFLDWAIEDKFAAGRPAWMVGGARFVETAAPWETLKLRMVNGAHSCIAYLGAVAGWQTIDTALKQPELRRCVESLLRDEVEPTLSGLPGLDVVTYRTRLLDRFVNPALAHRTQQVAMDGSQKIPQRWLGTLADQVNRKGDVKLLALCLAAWLRYLQGYDEADNRYDINDPLSDQLKVQLVVDAALDRDRQTCHTRAQALVQVAPVFGQHRHLLTDDFVEQIGHFLYLLNTEGVVQTLRPI